MELKEIKKINQNIYYLDANITRSNKVIFVAALIFLLVLKRDFQDPNKLTSIINFNSDKPINQIVELAKEEIIKLNLSKKTEDAIINSLKTIEGANTNIDKDKNNFFNFIENFICNVFPVIKPEDLFLETLYMEIDNKASKSDTGIVLTPLFAAELMIDLAQLDYKKDVVADLCSGTGLFSLLSYSRMLSNLNKDYNLKKISFDEFKKYEKRLLDSIIANDNEPKMVTLCLANFLLKQLNRNLVFYEDVLNLERSSFKIKKENEEVIIKPTKAILNPPYEESYKPIEIIKKNITLVSNDSQNNGKIIAIMPPQLFGKKNELFSEILNLATLEIIIKMQDDLFTESDKTPSVCIFVFNKNKAHSKDDIIRYYNFTDSGYVYLKDSGLVDKNNTYQIKKNELLKRIKNKNSLVKKEVEFKRGWNNFYDVNKELEIEAKIDPSKVKYSKDEADITLENIMIKKMLREKENLIKEVNNNFKDTDGSFEKYMIEILSEEYS